MERSESSSKRVPSESWGIRMALVQNEAFTMEIFTQELLKISRMYILTSPRQVDSQPPFCIKGRKGKNEVFRKKKKNNKKFYFIN
jgi:hypothetical protein